MEAPLSDVDITTVLIFFLVFLIVLFYMSIPRSSIPGPFALPLIGNLPLMLIKYGDDSRKYLSEMQKKYGDVFRLYLGPYLMVVFCGYDNMHDAFVKNADKFTDRPSRPRDVKKSHERTGCTGGFIWENGENWEKMRRFAIQSMRDFGVGKQSLEEVILDEVNVITGILKSREGQPIRDVKRIMTASSCNVIHHIVFGFRYDHDDKKFVRLLESLDILFNTSGNFVNSFIPEWLQKYGKKQKILDLTSKEIKQYIQKQVQEHQQIYDENNLRDFIDLFIQAQKEVDDNKSVSAVFRVILELFIAGTETTGSFLDRALLCMIAYPKIQQRCFREIQKVVGSGRRIKMSDRSSLLFTEATLLEVQRIANTAPTTLPHSCTENTIIGGHNIPKGAIILGFLTSSHFDDRSWEEVKEFRPERFIDKETGKINKKDHLIPFSLGPRTCPGESMAKMEMFLMFSNLLQKFKFSKYLGSDDISFESISGLTTSARPYQLKFNVRQLNMLKESIAFSFLFVGIKFRSFQETYQFKGI